MEHPWLTIILAGLVVGGAAFIAAMILWSWIWFKKRRQVPQVDPHMQVRLAIWRDGQKHVIF